MSYLDIELTAPSIVRQTSPARFKHPLAGCRVTDCLSSTAVFSAEEQSSAYMIVEYFDPLSE
jgi:hypothetical protein